MINKIFHSEKIFIILISAIAILFNAFPYIYQHQVAPPDKVYIGSFPIIYDKQTYLAEMVQGEKGNWKMINMYTTEPQKPVFLYPLYLGLGHIARITHASVENIFLISRFFFGIILLCVVLYFIRCFVPGQNQRKLAYFLALFASGLGWLSADQRSIDLWIPDAVPMVRFSYFPHIMLANALLLISFLLIYRSVKNHNSKSAIAAGIAAFALNFILPFESVLLYAFVVFFAIILFLKYKIIFSDNVKNIALFFIISIPSFLYMAYLGIADPIWKIVEEQNILHTPSLLNIFTGYGLVLFFSILGLRALNKKDRFKGVFFSLWILSVFALAHIPISLYPMQRRLLETALYAPLAITASFGIMAIYDYLKQKQIKNLNHKIFCFSALFLLPALMFGNLSAWFRAKAFIEAMDNPKFYLPKENIEAMQWLGQNTPDGSIILASFANSNNIPYFSDRMVYVGHGPMTIKINEKLEIAEDFYSGKYSPGRAFDFLKKERINYVFYSEEEKKSAYGKELDYFNPEDYSFLKKIYPLTQNIKNINQCPDNNVLPDSTSNHPFDCMGEGVYQNEKTTIYEFR